LMDGVVHEMILSGRTVSGKIQDIPFSFRIPIWRILISVC
jgi:hypothetical protein